MESSRRRHVLPEGIWALRTPVSPAAEAANSHVAAWVRAQGLARSAAAERRLAAVRLGDFAARVYPTASVDELFLATDWIAWLDFLDDQNDDGGTALDPAGFEAFVARLAEIGSPGAVAGMGTAASAGTDAAGAGVDTGTVTAARPDHDTHDTGPLGAALTDLWQRTKAQTSTRLSRRLHRHLVEYLLGNVHQAAYRSLGEVCDPSEYPALRRAAGGIAVTFDLIEVTGARELAPELYYSRTYQRLLTTAGDVVCWTNDLLTVEKESAAGDLLNLVLVIEAADRCSRDEASARAREFTAERLRAFHQAESDLPVLCTALSLDEEKRENLTACVALLRAWMRGHAEWGLATSRYSSRPAEPEVLEDLMAGPTGRERTSGV